MKTILYALDKELTKIQSGYNLNILKEKSFTIPTGNGNPATSADYIVN